MSWYNGGMDGSSWIEIIASMGASVIAAVATSFLTLGKYKEKVDRSEKEIEKLGEKMEKVCEDVAIVKERVQNIQKTVDKLADTAKAHSPIQLTEQGWNLVKDSGAYEIFERNCDKYLTELEAKEPNSQYDTQEKAYQIMSDKFNAPEFKPIEDWAFNHGKTTDEIIRILGYPLRDYYFEKHPEIVNPKETY